MAFANVTYAGTGAQTGFTIPFTYLAQSFIVVKLDDVLQTISTHYTIDNSTSKVNFLVAPTNAAVVYIQRVTANTEAGLVVNYSDGSGLTAADLNKSTTQLLHIIQEALDLNITLNNIGFIDDDTMSTATDAVVSSSESLKAYVDGTTGLGNIVDDVSPQSGADHDFNGFDVQFDDNTGIRDDSDNEQVTFQKTASAVNNLDVTNAATGSGPTISSTGDDTNVDLNLDTKATGAINLKTDGTTRCDVNASGLKLSTGARVGAVLDEDSMTSNSDTALATQQSIKAYVDLAGTSAAIIKIVSATTFSGASTVDIALDTATYTGFMLNLSDVVCSSGNRSLYVRFSNDGGSTFKSGSGDYESVVTDDVFFGGAGIEKDTEIILSFSNLSSLGGSHAITAHINIVEAASTSLRTSVTSQTAGVDLVGVPEKSHASAVVVTAEENDYIRVISSAGTISGSYTLYGIK